MSGVYLASSRLQVMAFLFLFVSSLQLESRPVPRAAADGLAFRLMCGGGSQPTHCDAARARWAAQILRPVRGGGDDSLMSVEDALASGDEEESSSPLANGERQPENLDGPFIDVADVADEDATGQLDLEESNAGQSPGDQGMACSTASSASAEAGSAVDTYGQCTYREWR